MAIHDLKVTAFFALLIVAATLCDQGVVSNSIESSSHPSVKGSSTPFPETKPSLRDNSGGMGSCYCLQDVLKNDIYNPVAVHFYRKPDVSKDHVMVVEQRGVISEHEVEGTEQVRELLDIQDRVVVNSTYGESRGLLSAVQYPHVDSDGVGKLFTYYIRTDNNEEYAYVSMFKTRDGIADPDSERVLLRVHQPYIHGNGGPMFFGVDGYLYIATGDGGEEDDPNGYAQSKATFHGKVLRLDVSGRQDFSGGPSGVAKLYAVPGDNPFVGTKDALPEIFALGFRNLWGCSQDRRSIGFAEIFCAETGTDRFDEINVIERGKNYGWNIKEGSACHDARNCGPIENEGVPIYNFAHTANHALVGGYVYAGYDFDWMTGQDYYTFGDVVSGQTWALKREDNGTWLRYDWSACSGDDFKVCPNYAKQKRLQHLLAFGQDTRGELYLVMTDSLVATKQGAKLFKMVPHYFNSSYRTKASSLSILLGVLCLLIKKKTPDFLLRV